MTIASVQPVVLQPNNVMQYRSLLLLDEQDGVSFGTLRQSYQMLTSDRIDISTTIYIDGDW